MSGGLALRRVDGNVTTAKTGRTAWFLLPPQRWSFRADAERDQLINAGASRYAALVGRRIRLRVTSRPYPVEQWARSVDEAFPDRQPGWAAHLLAEQRHVLGLTLATKEVYLGVEMLAKRRGWDAERRELDAIVAGPGLEGRPARPEELEYLLHRSVSLGTPAPLTLPPPLPTWEEEDLAGFTDRSHWSAAPLSRTVRVVADVDGRQHVRHVAVLTLGRMSDLDIPGGMEPWLQRSDRLFPVEWSVIADIVPVSKVRHELQGVLARIKAQLAHYADHDEIPPAKLLRQRDRAVQVEDEVTDPNPLNTRVHAWVRAAVSGPTEQDALDRAQQLADLYLPQLPFSRGAAQYATAREFIPGEPLATSAHKRRMPVTTFAAAAPAVTAIVGDRAGFHIGATAGSSMRAVCWHPWASMEQREGSGLTIISGTLGAGKSSLQGICLFWSALAGVRSIALDPAGPLARLCSMPELRDRADAIDLMNARPGALNPYSVIPDPREDHYVAEREPGMTDEQWQHHSAVAYVRAVRTTEAARRTLCVGTLTELLPLALTSDPDVLLSLHDAVSRVPAHRAVSPRQVLAALAEDDGPKADRAHQMARYLHGLAELSQAQLIFPPDDGEVADPVRDDLILQILTMRGNVLPQDGKPRAEWSVAETVGVPLMTLAAHLTTRHVYSADMNERKLVVVDEVQQVTRFAAGASLVRGLSADSRKFNTRAVLSGHNVADSLGAGLENYVDNVFVGRTVGRAQQEAALVALGVETGVGYEDVIGGLSPRERQSDRRIGHREFVLADGDGGVEKIRVEVPESLRGVLDTTADPTKVLLAKREVVPV